MTIDATVMNWVYISDSESRKHSLRNVVKTTTTGFFSSLSGFLTGVSTPQTQTSSLPASTPQVDLIETSTTSIILSVFSAEITVRLNSKLSSEIHRSTKKNPPSSMKYELIYVGWCLRTSFLLVISRSLRLQKINMMQVSRRIWIISILQEVSSKDYALILMGMLISKSYITSLITLSGPELLVFSL